MTKKKGRKTTLQERIDIVTDQIQSRMSYAEIAEKYDVSYHQVYQWVHKYRANGVDGLIDRRGNTKPVEEMTEIERLKAENRILKAQLERKELENIFLKKVDEIERRRS
jgi:transposase-like protein